MVDDASDKKTEQVSISARSVDLSLTAQEVFFGLHETVSTTGETLINLILDILQRLGLNLDNLRGQCYDGAANMAGQFKGVRSRIFFKNNKAVFVHCVNHCLNLVLQESAKRVSIVCDVF